MLKFLAQSEHCRVGWIKWRLWGGCSSPPPIEKRPLHLRINKIHRSYWLKTDESDLTDFIIDLNLFLSPQKNTWWLKHRLTTLFLSEWLKRWLTDIEPNYPLLINTNSETHLQLVLSYFWLSLKWVSEWVCVCVCVCVSECFLILAELQHPLWAERECVVSQAGVCSGFPLHEDSSQW